MVESITSAPPTEGVVVIGALLNNTMSAIRRHDGDDRKFGEKWRQSGGNECLDFVFEDGRVYRFTHYQCCCEDVSIEDVCGDLDDLIGTPILLAEERTSHSEDKSDNSYTWTFYEFRTVWGSVTVRWRGTSNGYYSEAVDHGFLSHNTSGEGVLNTSSEFATITYLRSSMSAVVRVRPDMPIEVGDVILTSISYNKTVLRASGTNFAVVRAFLDEFNGKETKSLADYHLVIPDSALRVAAASANAKKFRYVREKAAKSELNRMLEAEDKTARYRNLAANNPRAAALLAFLEGTAEFPEGTAEFPKVVRHRDEDEED